MIEMNINFNLENSVVTDSTSSMNEFVVKRAECDVKNDSSVVKAMQLLALE